MDNVTYIDIPQLDGSAKTHAIIAHADGSFTSMLKSDYDTLVSNSSTPQAGN